MQGLNLLAIIGATVAAFAFSSLWYMAFSKARMKLLGNDKSANADLTKVPASQIRRCAEQVRPAVGKLD